MSVSLVKRPRVTAASHVFTAGSNMAGYLPESDPAVFATLGDAVAYLATELEESADYLYGCDDPDMVELAASVAASAELVKAGADGDITWATRLLGGSWATFEDLGNGIDTVFWVARTELGVAFGGDTESEAYLDIVDALSEA